MARRSGRPVRKPGSRDNGLRAVARSPTTACLQALPSLTRCARAACPFPVRVHDTSDTRRGRNRNAHTSEPRAPSGRRARHVLRDRSNAALAGLRFEGKRWRGWLRLWFAPEKAAAAEVLPAQTQPANERCREPERPNEHKKAIPPDRDREAIGTREPVSYTHLTLPTS